MITATAYVTPHRVRFEFLHALTKKIAVLGDLTSCRLVKMCQCVGESYCLHWWKYNSVVLR